MSALTHAKSGWAIGPGKPLAVIAGLNVLENKALALTVGAQLKAICAELGLPYVFKASFDKANRSSIHSYRGPGLEEGLQILKEVKAELDVPICTDLHDASQAEPVAAVETHDLVERASVGRHLGSPPALVTRVNDVAVRVEGRREAPG